eukprot:CAMPEP_0181301754 /NCGR_PEP_ID=MMETSP1101-20121128/7599_1 /TAXON_ID=46948 /ORGANISM="Rhodomonas abbreviata, Strain Caron Lab Isolate" /LENGTH=244 /DNA_ID=CAMNT_0023407093 /DNA_START=124 /DNA_END=858 /DNA_ORIENTATION=-
MRVLPQFLSVALVVFSALNCDATKGRQRSFPGDGIRVEAAFIVDDSTVGELPALQEVFVSSRCAAVTLAMSGALGNGAAAAFSPKVQSLLHLSTQGIFADTFESSWESTMPHVAKGTLSQMLQSVAMGEKGDGVILTGIALGGSSGVYCMQVICKAVDSVEVGSASDVAVSALHSLVSNTALAGSSISNTLQWMAEQVPGSPMQQISDAGSSLSTSLKGLKEQVSQTVSSYVDGLKRNLWSAQY